MNWQLIGFTLLAVLAVMVFLFGPFAFIWSLNTIFELGIVWTWKHWFAVHGLFIFFNARHSTSGD